jgi:hypothetical protein
MTKKLLLFLILTSASFTTSCETAISPISEHLLPQGDRSPWGTQESPSDGDITIIITWGSPDSAHTDSVRVVIPKNSECTYEWREN